MRKPILHPRWTAALGASGIQDTAAPQCCMQTARVLTFSKIPAQNRKEDWAITEVPSLDFGCEK
jgi:hypothetical protein